MVVQYAVNIADVGIDRLKPYCGILSPIKQKRVEKYRFEADKVRCFVGELMLRYIVVNDFNINNEDISIAVSDTGKPYFTGAASTVSFNISHSHDWVVCAIGDTPVGIDVEYVKDKEVDLASYVLSRPEYEVWNQIPDVMRNAEFYRYWTIKESYSKYVGQGLGIGFSEITAEKTDDDLWKIEQDECSVILSQKLSERYYLAVCIEKKYLQQLQHEVKTLDIEDLISFAETHPDFTA